MSKQTAVALEQRIASALSNTNISSVELREMGPETEAALTEAEATAQGEREKALDPVLSADTAEAEKVVWEAEFKRDRLRLSLSRLRQRHDEVQAAERAARGQADYDTVEAKRCSPAAASPLMREHS
jgi:hypothetical protein